MTLRLREIDTITVEHKAPVVRRDKSDAKRPKRRLVEVTVCTHVSTSRRYAPNGQRECARRVRQATLRAIRGELRRFNRSAAA